MARRARTRRSERASKGITQPPWRQIVNPYAPVKVISDDHVETIHHQALRLLEEIGMDFWSEEALDILTEAGADVDRGNRHVKFDHELIEQNVARAPAEFTMYARNPERNLRFGTNFINFGCIGTPAYCSDIDSGRRPGTYEDLCKFVRIVHRLDIVHFIAAYPVEPQDLPVPVRHLEAYRAYTTLTDKVWRAVTIGRQPVEDAIDMLGISRGVDRDHLAKEPGLFANINVNSPLRFDGPLLDALIAMARCGQVVLVSPFTMAGATAPVTLAGTLALQHAEALAGIALAQIVRPGCPVIYGSFATNVDMRSGAPAFGTPEMTKMTIAGGQMARRQNLPYRSSNATASNVVDAQAAYESQMSLWASVLGHASMVHHAAGWLEGGLTGSFEKMIVDAEMLQMMAEFLRPIEVDEETLAFEAVAEVGPGGHFFGAKHTLERYETAFYQPLVSDWRNFEAWEEGGGLTATQRANGIWKGLLDDYEPPEIDESTIEELNAFVDNRKRQIGTTG
ncbi:MAG: trimethylamine methyltransferase family protein [Alphaproteobacteria bacterium]|jgi:trimethylamine--corrinoid protein Co-methyltransferase